MSADPAMTANLDAWRAAQRSFSHAGHDLAYWEEGSGETLLLIHGFPTASWDWAPIWPALAQRFRLVAMDMLGFGFSAKPRPHVYSILEQADLYEALLAKLGIRRCHVLAHDYGDTVAQELLARFEERRASGAPSVLLRSICFLNGGLFPESHHPRPVQVALAGPNGAAISALLDETRFSQGFGEVFGPDTQPSAAELADFWQLVAHADGQRIWHLLIRYMEERREHRERWVGALLGASIPLRLVDGPEDPVSGAHLAERYRELVPGADVVLLPGIGHYPQVEDPDGVLRAFFAFHDERVRG
jgi:pimeloyl-ACP methyl ester carboxylesterase